MGLSVATRSSSLPYTILGVALNVVLRLLVCRTPLPCKGTPKTCVRVHPYMSEVSPRSVTESSLGDGKFFFSTTTYGGAYVVVVMFVCLSVQFFFVCPRNYLNNIQDIIKVHFCQLRLVVSFNNILYT